jgi:serine/threonine-protein kinase RsbW
MTIQIIDHGLPFDPRNIPEPDVSADLKERDNHGLGLYFMQKLMDVINFEFSTDTGNVLTMVKCLHPHH